MNTKQVIFANPAEAVLFHGEVASLSVFGVVDTCRSYFTIAPVCQIDGAAALDYSNLLAVCPSEVEFI